MALQSYFVNKTFSNSFWLTNLNRRKNMYSKKNSFGRSDFPEGFLFGTASSAYQYEGAREEAPRGESVWDTFVRKYPGLYIRKNFFSLYSFNI